LNKRAEKLAEKKLQEKQHQTAVQKVEKIIAKLPEEVQEEALAYFEEITEGKLLDEDKAKKYADMVTLYVQKNIKGDKTEALANMQSTGLKNSKKVSNEPQYVVRD
jgi:predicted transcriptional regulator